MDLTTRDENATVSLVPELLRINISFGNKFWVLLKQKERFICLDYQIKISLALFDVSYLKLQGWPQDFVGKVDPSPFLVVIFLFLGQHLLDLLPTVFSQSGSHLLSHLGQVASRSSVVVSKSMASNQSVLHVENFFTIRFKVEVFLEKIWYLVSLSLDLKCVTLRQNSTL